jgi:hypothetical protein
MNKILINIAVLTFSFSIAVCAQDNHYWNIFGGNESAVLGGVVLDGVNDYSTSYFNPGNIAFLKNSGLGVSGNIYGYMNFKHQNANGEGNDAIKEKFDILPNMSAGASPFNPKADSKIGYLFFERQSASVGLNTRVDKYYDVIPTRSFNLDNHIVNFYDGMERYIGEINTDHQLTEYWGGVCYGKKLSDKIGIGFTLFGSMRDQTKKTDLSLFAVDTANSVSATTDWNYFIDYIDYRVLGKFGFVYKSESFNFGLTVTTPSLHIYGTGIIGGRVTSTGVYVGKIEGTHMNRPYDYVASKRESDVSTKYESPLSIGIGIKKDFGSWRIRFAAEWFNDVSNHVLIQADDPFFTITNPETATSGRKKVIVKIPLLSIKQQAKTIINYGIAVEKQFTKSLLFYLSCRTDYSSFKSGEDYDITLGKDDDWDIFRFTTGGTYKFSKTILGLGFQYSFSRDNNLISDINLNPHRIDNNTLFLLNTTPTTTKIIYDDFKLILAFTYLFSSKL